MPAGDLAEADVLFAPLLVVADEARLSTDDLRRTVERGPTSEERNVGEAPRAVVGHEGVVEVAWLASRADLDRRVRVGLHVLGEDVAGRRVESRVEVADPAGRDRDDGRALSRRHFERLGRLGACGQKPLAGGLAGSEPGPFHASRDLAHARRERVVLRLHPRRPSRRSRPTRSGAAAASCEHEGERGVPRVHHRSLPSTRR